MNDYQIADYEDYLLARRAILIRRIESIDVDLAKIHQTELDRLRNTQGNTQAEQKLLDHASEMGQEGL